MPKNFVSYGDAETLMASVDDRIKKNYFEGTEDDWNNLTDEQRAVYDQRPVFIKGDDVPIDLSSYQRKALTTPLTIGGVQQDYVEGALGGLNDLMPSDVTPSNQLSTLAFAGKGANQIRLTETTDLDDITTEGWYFSDGADTLVNKPFTTCYNNIIHVQQQGTTGRIVQTIYSCNSNCYYHRVRAGGTWSAWKGFDGVYSTSETFTGKTWIDGKPLYRKVISVPAASLPSGSIQSPDTKSYSLGMSPTNYPFMSVARYILISGSNTLDLPHDNVQGNTRCGFWLSTGTSWTLSTSASFVVTGTYTAYAILEYTKTT